MNNKLSVSFMLVVLICMFSLILGAASEQVRVMRPNTAAIKNVQMMKFQPDLKITYCSVVPNNVHQLKVTVENIGRTASGQCILRVEDLSNKNNPPKVDIQFMPLNSLPLVRQKPPAPPVQNSRTVIVTCPFTVYAGKYIRVTIDATKIVNELNENNNTYIYDTTIK